MDPQTKFALSISEAAQHQRAARLLINEGARELELAERKRAQQGSRFSIVRAVHAMTREGGGGLRDGYEREVAQEYAMRAGRSHDPNRVLLPWGVLMGERAMIVGTSSAGGYLTSNLDVTIGEALRGYGVAFDAGIDTLSGLKSNVQVAQEVGGGTAYWVQELGTTTESESTFTGVTLTPKVAGGYVELSRSLLTGAPGVDAHLGRSLRRRVGQLLDAAIIGGTGTSQPLGIVNTVGVTTTTGTSLSYTNLLNEQKEVCKAYVNEANHKFIGSPDVRATLGVRAIGTSAGLPPFMWQDDKVVGRTAVATPAVGTQKLVHGDFSRALFASFGPDVFELQVNPYANFQAGIVGVRVLVSCDLALLNVSALRVVTGIT